MSPRRDPLIDQEAPWDHALQHQVSRKLADLYIAIADLADIITAHTGEIVALRHAIDGGQARAENARLAAKRRWEKENGNG